MCHLLAIWSWRKWYNQSICFISSSINWWVSGVRMQFRVSRVVEYILWFKDSWWMYWSKKWRHTFFEIKNSRAATWRIDANLFNRRRYVAWNTFFSTKDRFLSSLWNFWRINWFKCACCLLLFFAIFRFRKFLMSQRFCYNAISNCFFLKILSLFMIVNFFNILIRIYAIWSDLLTLLFDSFY